MFYMSEIVKKLSNAIRDKGITLDDNVRLRGSKENWFGLKQQTIDRNYAEELDRFNEKYGTLSAIEFTTINGNMLYYEPTAGNKWTLEYVTNDSFISKDDIKKIQNILEISI